MFKVYLYFCRNLALILLFIDSFSNCDSVCYKDDKCAGENQFRYVFYEVNPPEGFNLRRDVYMRFAVLAYKMQRSKDPALNKFKLVLPPWSHLLHWNYSGHPEHIPWGLYFDLESLQMFAPVIEMHEFFSRYKKKYSKVIIEEVYTLQHFADMFETGNFEERMKIEKCQSANDLTFFFYENITYNHAHCLSYHGPTTKLTELFLNTSAETILINHAEVALHPLFGSKLYWQARRSMRFNKELRNIAGDFRRLFLNSTDESDNTALPANWRDEKPKRDAIGGPYIAVHLRRRDFVRSRPNDAPTLHAVANQIIERLETLRLDAVFIATDGSDGEFQVLSKKLSPYKVLRYIPPQYVKEKFKDGGVAIVDQIICSYARYFIGTGESTFTYRIQEEREILGFPVDRTFNILCKDQSNCVRPSIWRIVF